MRSAPLRSGRAVRSPAAYAVPRAGSGGRGEQRWGHSLANIHVQADRGAASLAAGRGASEGTLRRDFAVEPTTPNRAVRVLTAAQVQQAIAYNQTRHTDAAEIALVRDILGIPSAPAVIDEDFVQAVVRMQAGFGETQDGRIGGQTATRIAREIVAEADYLGPANLGRLAPEFQLKTDLQALIDANNTTYADYRALILAATIIQRRIVLLDEPLLRSLDARLPWNNFARCIELLGRTAPTGAEMIANAPVRGALATAWGASNAAVTIWNAHDPNPALAGHACNPPPGPPPPPPAAHEEGGFVYLNLINGNLSTRAVAAGGQAALVLAAPVLVADSVVVGGFHTHPNVGACWGAPFFSAADLAWTGANGVPLLMRGAFPAVANTTDHATGASRAHLAGNRGLPGAGGGLAPQATVDGKNDEV